MDTSGLSRQVSTIIGQLHSLFDEIGVASHERESREAELFTALSETLNNQLRVVTAEKSKLTEEAVGIITTIHQMEASLEDRNPNDRYPRKNEDLQVTAPLTRCVKDLKEKYYAIARIHQERFEEIKSEYKEPGYGRDQWLIDVLLELAGALDSYSSHLEPSFLKATLPPLTNNAAIPPTFNLSPSYVSSLDEEFTRVYEEYNKRVTFVKSTAEDIVNLWAELGTPQAQTDSAIIKNYRETPEQLGLHERDLSRLNAKKDKLLEEKRAREKRLKELKADVEGLWERLSVSEMDRKRFHAGTRGCGLRVINDFEAELDRLNELKRQNLHIFVEDARIKLQDLWDALYYSEDEMLDFTPAFSDVISDALLSAHENEISRLEILKEQQMPILQRIERHRTLVHERDELAASSQDGTRLLKQKGERRDPTRLLREEKSRKRVAKELPKMEADLRQALEQWEDEYGRPFLVHGNPYSDEMDAAAAKAPPPRPKTPSALPPAAKASKPGQSAPTSRQGSVMRAPPSRAGAKTPVGTIRRNPANSTASTAVANASNHPSSKPTSPSKIPARAPLGTMKTGSNSPERRAAPPASRPYDNNTIHKMAPPARAPPPKMRDFFHAPAHPGPAPLPTPSVTSDSENWRCASVLSNNSGPVRQITPEDVYDDREHMSYAPPSFPGGGGNGYAHPHPGYFDHHHHRPSSRAGPPPPSRGYPRAPPSAASYAMPLHDERVPSTASTASNAVSGSENWETYDDASDPEPEPDARAAVHAARLRAAAAGKRATPDGGYGTVSPGGHAKKFKSAYEGQGRVREFIEENGRMVPVGQGEGWEDEEAF